MPKYHRILAVLGGSAILAAACVPPTPPAGGPTPYANGVESFVVVGPNGGTCEIQFHVQLNLHDRDYVRVVDHTEVYGTLPGCTFANWQFVAWLNCLPPASPTPAANTCGLQDLPVSYLEQTSIDYRFTANPHNNVLRVEMQAYLIGYSTKWAYGYDDTDPMTCDASRCLFASPSMN